MTVRLRSWFLILCVSSVVGCQARSVRPNLDALDAESRIAGIIAAAESDDPEQLVVLAGALGDEDAAIRLFAAEALRRRTGQDFGYHAYDPPARRGDAAARWRAFVTCEMTRAPTPDEAPSTDRTAP